jgi:hypothetical protein
MSGAAVLMLATAPDERWRGLLRDLARRAGQRHPLTVHETPLAGPPGWRRVWTLFRTLRRLAPPAGFAVVGAHSAEEHYAALLYRLLARHPVTVMKSRFDGVPLRDSRINRWLHSRLTGINLFWTPQDEHRMRGGRQAGELLLERPLILQQERLGPDGPAIMLEHALAALLEPARDSVTGPKRDHSHVELSYVTHFYLNQRSTATAFDLLRSYESYDPDLLDRIHFVMVDDGSPLQYEVPAFNLNLTWLKVRQDIPWNNPGARNLGVVYAKSDKVLLTDVDHQFPADTLRHMVAHRGCGKRIYKLFRKDPATGKLERGHPNIFFLSRARFFEQYGYDEEFCGAYASDDYRFVKYQKAHGSPMPHLPRRYWCTDRPKIDRAKGYHSLVRDHSFNTPVDRRKDIELSWHGHGAGHSRMFLNFEWDVLSQQHRPAPAPRPIDRWWKRRWWLRTLLPRV